uniref:RIN4 pathogenic type III effector avirulence factor Avr cleavage site domain-containing protein n=1 Tax=Opuntia streptacantha TaxID=393608 RepID=A0A7C9E6S1_OPUST
MPKFGNWESGENISYSTCFENARRVSSSDKMNSKNSPEKPDLHSKQEASPRADVTRAKHGRTLSQEDGELRKAVGSPSRCDEGRRTTGNSTPQRHAGVSGDAFKKAGRLNGGGMRSAGHSPLHPRYQAKLGMKESAMSSPSWEKKSSYEGNHGLAPSTPGRSRLRSVHQGSETPDRGASVPKFGAWDETDPSSADGFTHIFNRVKEERHGDAGNVTSVATDSRRSNGQKHHKSNESKGCYCFPWGRK